VCIVYTVWFWRSKCLEILIFSVQKRRKEERVLATRLTQQIRNLAAATPPNLQGSKEGACPGELLPRLIELVCTRDRVHPHNSSRHRATTCRHGSPRRNSDFEKFKVLSLFSVVVDVVDDKRSRHFHCSVQSGKCLIRFLRGHVPILPVSYIY
jgi:hypothetical protein